MTHLDASRARSRAPTRIRQGVAAVLARRGFTLGARPVGAYVIEAGHVRWEPADDVGRIVLQLTLAALGVVLLLRRPHG